MLQKERLKWFCNAILGRDLDVDCAEDKQIIQKTVFLAESLNKNFDYKFGWHVRGVYSSPLTVDLYEIKDADSNYLPTEQEKEFVRKLSAMKDIVGDSNKSFEIISAIIYAEKSREMNIDDIPEFIKKVMPWFTNREIRTAISATERFKAGLKI